MSIKPVCKTLQTRQELCCSGYPMVTHWLTDHWRTSAPILQASCYHDDDTSITVYWCCTYDVTVWYHKCHLPWSAPVDHSACSRQLCLLPIWLPPLFHKSTNGQTLIKAKNNINFHMRFFSFQIWKYVILLVLQDEASLVEVVFLQWTGWV